MSTNTMTATERFARNLEEVARRFPELHQRIQAMGPVLTKVVWEGDQAVDIDLRSGVLYKQNAHEFARQQVEAFAANPARLYYNVPTQCAFDSLISRQVFDGIMASLKRHQIERLHHIPSTRPGYLIVLGVGLGLHLMPLVERFPAQHLVLVEPFEEFLFHSLHVADWAALFDHCDRNGITVHLNCRRQYSKIFEFVGEVFDANNPTLLDGTLLFSHYPLWDLAEAKRLIVNEMPRRMVTIGYFEDERKMLWNTATNLHRLDFRLLEGLIRPRGEVPVFLIGAGPSFDEVADIVRQWRDYAIIITSGSALPAALRHGIIPDFHTEVENGPEQYEKTKYVLERFPDLFPDGKLTGIRLIATTTLNPRVAPLFEEVYFFFREAVSSTTAFGTNIYPLRGSAPTVANTSLAAAACMGFGDIYLFGFDCGWRDGQEHHAKETIYYGTDEFRLEEMQSNYTLPGNFGGTVQSELVFEWSRTILQLCIPAYRLTRVFNCSDGALIEGATPKVAEALEFSTPIDRPAMLERIAREAPFYTAGSFFKDFDLEPLRQEVRDYTDAVRDVLDNALAEDTPFSRVVDELWKLVDRFSKNRRAVSAIYYSTVSELKQASLFINRVPDDDGRRKVTRDFITLFQSLHQNMREELLTILDEMEGLFTGWLDPFWTKGLPTTPGTSY